MKSEDIIKAYDSVAKEYNLKAEKDEYKAYLFIQDLALKFSKEKNPRVLDLGCGTGLSSFKFLEKDLEVIGIDISQKMLEEAKKYSYKKLICQNLEKPLKVEDNFFDIVTLSGVMEFVNSPLNFFREISSKMKEGGIFVLSVPKRYPKNSLLRKELERKSYSQKEIEDLFNKTGFDLLKRKSVFGYYKEVLGKKEKSYFWIYVLKKR